MTSPYGAHCQTTRSYRRHIVKAKTTSKNDTKLNIGQRRKTSMVDKNSAKTPMNIKLSLYFTIIFIYAADILSVSHITLITI